MQIGLVGLPFSGKSTLFQTMTRTPLDEATLAKQQSQQAMVKVPDARVDKLAEFFNPKKKVYTAVEFVDVVGLKKGDHNSTQFTNAFLGAVKTNDAIMHVVRMFDDPLYPHPEGSVDPARDIEILETEFLLSDMAMVDNRVEKLRKQVQKIQDDKLKHELVILERFKEALDNEQPLRTVPIDKQDAQLIKGFQFLTQKPILVVLNMEEDKVGESDTIVAQLQEKFADRGIAVDAFFGKIEMELAQMEDEDAAEFMKDYGIEESALTRIIRAAYDMLGLISFLTFGEDECRAWTVREGSPAPEAAGVIHSDLQDRFIRAEVVHFTDFVEYGSISACKESGHWRLEGKEYVVKDGDMLTIRHG
ncbi:MAG: redox-regulated ATPase YchF [Bacteroidota bacterium]|nr:redox-regulated ATPase YchF [Bacteroidota bacterium]